MFRCGDLTILLLGLAFHCFVIEKRKSLCYSLGRPSRSDFVQLGFVEIFGTGITRIKQLYAEGLMKPDFEVLENAIKIVLPLFEKDANLSEDEKVIYKLLSKTMLKPISEIAPYIPFGKSKTTKLLKDMGEKGVIAIEGKGRGTKYIIK